MFKAYENSLFFKDKSSFEEIEHETLAFNTRYNGDNIIQDDIFNVLKNCSNINSYPLELFRYSVDDADFCACSFIKEGHIFVLINTKMLLSKQIFATAHELYHIWRFFENNNENLISKGSVLKSTILDHEEMEKEDMEANAFAGLLLAPESVIRSQMKIYRIDSQNIGFKDILKLMDIFAIPYKAMILRLYEIGVLSDDAVKEYFEKADCVNDMIEVTNLGKRWNVDSHSEVVFGSLKELLYENKCNELITESRQESDEARIRELIRFFSEG